MNIFKAVECVAGFRYIIIEAGFYSNVIPRVFDCMSGQCARFNFRLGQDEILLLYDTTLKFASAHIKITQVASRF